MRKFPEASFDLIITSPPYNMCSDTPKKTSGKWKQRLLEEGYDTYSDNILRCDYVDWQRSCLFEMLRLISETGAIFYNHKWRIQNGILDDRHDIIQGFPVRQIIIWQKLGGVNFNNSHFLPTYEVIYLIAKPKFRLSPKANALGDIWRIGQDTANNHPASFPVKLPECIIRSTDAKTVLDPFMGSGTTAVAAVRQGRKFVGIDISQKYRDIARKRISRCKINMDNSLFGSNFDQQKLF